MSIILKGIDLPKEGEWLEVIIKPSREVIVDTIRYRDNALLKTEYGLVIQIPKGHGRLIDESEAVKGWCEGCAFKDTEECADCKDKEMCKYAPTLLEREETE